MHTDEDPDPRDAEDVYAEFQAGAEGGEGVDLERYCDEHPRLAAALRALHSLHGDPEPDAPNSTKGSFGEMLAGLPAREEGAPFEAGASIGPYTIQDVLGEGGFAFVFRAEQHQPVRRTVALKTLKLGMDTKQVLARFEAERQALALMSHRHIAKVFDAGVTEDGRPYFVMEYVSGVPITKYCDEHRLRTRDRLELFVLVCEAIAHAHQRAIIHRDLKPSNVLVTTEGEHAVPKVIDFGIAKATNQDLTDQTLFTEIGQVIGTPEYMSPEQAAGEGIDTRTDIYALGVLLYELLSGVRPFDAEKLRGLGFPAILNFIQEEEPRRLSTRLTTRGETLSQAAQARSVTPTALAREVRGDLDWITMKCLAKEPDRRYTTASDLADDVGRHLRLEPVSAGPPTWNYRFSKFLRKRRAAVLTTAGIVLTGLVVTFASLELKSRYDAEARVELSAELVTEGNRIRHAADALRTNVADQEEVYADAYYSVPFWKPVWERRRETTAWQELQDLQRRLEDQYSEAVLKYAEARKLVPARSDPWSRALAALKEVYVEVPMAFVARVMLKQQLTEALGSAEAVRDSLARDRSVLLKTSPPGAEVFCFRYEEHEHRLLPLPFDPVTRAVDEPVLRVSHRRTRHFLDNPTRAPLEPGDRVLRVGNTRVRTPGEFAAAIRGVVDEEITVEVLRGDATRELSWYPFRAGEYGTRAHQNNLHAGEVVDLAEQFGFVFEGYPLEFTPMCRLGETTQKLSFKLPEGSYLLVLRKSGYIDARLPVSARFPGKIEETVQLIPNDGVPDGFVQVPGGPTELGGDDQSYLQNLKHREQRVAGFFISRFEVTFASYLEFLSARGGESGRILPDTEEVANELRKARREESVELRPLDNLNQNFLVERHEETWRPRNASFLQWPVLGVSYNAAVEYAHWLSKTRGNGWRFRLPTDIEWERAARGADGRKYTWGNYLTWTNCWTIRSNFRERRVAPHRTGVYPTDESPFGVRDVAGSVREFTSGRPRRNDRLISTRGGGWDSLDEFELRTDSREGRLPESASRNVGFRLVAERVEK